MDRHDQDLPPLADVARLSLRPGLKCNHMSRDHLPPVCEQPDEVETLPGTGNILL